MEARSTKLLAQLKVFFDDLRNNAIDLSHITEGNSLKDVSATAEGNIPSDCYRLLKLLKDLETAVKTSNSIREQSLCANLDESNVSSTGEDQTVELNEENQELYEIREETTEERKTFRVLMDASNFMPEELYVKILGKYLVVHGEHEALLDEHGDVARKFTRKFEIPEEVDTETFRAFVDCYRVLTVEASLKSTKDEDLAFDVPIYEETDSHRILPAFKSLGPEFEKLAKLHMEDWKRMRRFAQNLEKQRPSDYIPMEEVI